jgi:TRAP-type transport system small permease protein
MNKLNYFIQKVLNAFIIIAFSVMCILVFLNVVLRYVFSTGLTSAEEISRYLFVYIVFLGAIIATKERMHFNVDLLVKILPQRVQMFLNILANLIVLTTLWLFFEGSVKMSILTARSASPVTGLPLAILYVVGIIASSSIFVMTIYYFYYDFIKQKDEKA